MTPRKKPGNKSSSVPKLSPETQADGSVAFDAPQKARTKDTTGIKQEDDLVSARTPRSGKRKREVEEVEKAVEPINAAKEPAKRQSTKKGKDESLAGVPSPENTKRRSTVKAKKEFKEKVGIPSKETKGEATKEGEGNEYITKSKRKKEKPTAKEEAESDNGSEKKNKIKRKTKEEKEAEAMPLAARTKGLRMFVGAHVSCAKGVQNSVTNALHIGGNAFAMFLKSQRKWENPPLQEEHRNQFKAFCEEHTYDAASHVLPHGSYLVNLAQEDPEKASQAYNAFLDDLQRCDALGIKLYNFHPGSTGSAPRPSAIGRIASALNRAHAATTTVTPVLEAMAGAGNVIGSTFEDIRDIISLVDNKARIGVCIDTCHVFAAGYDLRSPKAFAETLEKFNSIVGMKYLRALHLNDSKAPLASHRDLHQNIGLGFLGLRAFHNVMNEKCFQGLPLVLETPIDRKDEKGKDVEDKGVWVREIKMLEGLIGMDGDGADFKKLEKELADKGAAERAKYQEAFERKKVKEVKKEKGQMKLSFDKKKKEIDSDASVGD